MSLEAQTALQAALIDALRADSSVRALLGEPARVYVHAPRVALYPHMTIGPCQSRPLAGTDGEASEHSLTLTCVSRFSGAEEANAAVAAVRACLHGASLTLQGHRLVNLIVAYCDVYRGADWRYTFGVVRLRAVTEPLT